jgi:uncharacterized membrane-anchored protein YhcB (DUF1043 family)
MVIAVIGDIIRRRSEHSKASRQNQTQIHVELNELKKRVDEMQEQIADLYIQQHEQKLNKRIDESQ